ncbi:5-amino-6-(5-phospho-D-ribitylamino)uracil phosphatase YigB [Vibrio tasmaniensis]|uniref:5-amino-6-(5-phospho-D-ribitylamino)uracil phosphatase YigB n=1 Tax=Vibrio tasmaniensis TaxID=212663 RepID=UPI001080DD4B|nr:5-amino-6-(5-phospho-D-ribitylamino)uracil phosphatase YigB [Vibrio tasmaniensis]
MRIYRGLKPIKAMTFDLDDTLYDNWPVIMKVEKEMAQWLYQKHPVSASLSLEEWQGIKQQVASENPALKHDVTVWRETQIKRGLLQLGYSQQQAKQAAREGIEHALWLRNQVEVPQETHRVMAELSQRIPLVAITNGNVDPHKIGLGQYFQLILKAGPDGRAKPYPDMFDKAQQYLNCDAENILHVGDHLRTDVYGAKTNGFQACWFNDTGSNLYSSPKATVLPDVEIEQLSDLMQLI